MKNNKFKKVAQAVILTEIKSLKKLKTSIDNNCQKVSETIINCKKGKIILSGVGKSGIIAKKISCFFTSLELILAEFKGNSEGNFLLPDNSFKILNVKLLDKLLFFVFIDFKITCLSEKKI